MTSCASGSSRSLTAKSPRGGASGRQSPLRTSLAVCARLPGCPRWTVSSCATSRKAGRRTGPASSGATYSSLRSLDDLYEVLDGDGPELEFRVARAADEIVVTVSFAAADSAGSPGAERSAG